MDDRNFISFWIETLSAKTIKNFPEDFTIGCVSEAYNLPGNGLLVGKEFSGKYELISAEGSEVLKVGSYEKAKYFIYGNKNKPRVLSVPIENSTIKEITTKYDRYLDSIIKRIDQDYRNNFPGSENFTDILNQIFNHLNLIRLK